MIKKYYNPKSSRELRERLEKFRIIMAITFLILFLRLFKLQIIDKDYYLAQAIKNMEKENPVPAFRGDIYDRNFISFEKGVGNLLATTKSSFSLVGMPLKIKDKEIEELSNLLNIDKESIKNTIKEAIKKRLTHQLITIKANLNPEELIKFSEHKESFPNIEIQNIPRRVYPQKNLTVHVVGYVGKISKKEYYRLRKTGRYYRNSIIGKMGVEKSYDLYLRGIDGKRKFIVDTAGRPIGERIAEDPIPGDLVVLTIDKKIQEIAYKNFGDNKGSLIILKPSTGEILALISKPDFDPQIMIDQTEDIYKILQSPDKPFLNRAIQAKYPPASTFKVIMAIASLEEHKVTKDEIITCKGYIRMKDRNFRCWMVHGPLNIVGALAKSCNVFFYNMGLRLKSDNIFKWAYYFGLNKKTDIDLPGELDLSRYWNKHFLKSRWFVGDTLNLSIGQGFAQVTPIQMADVYSLVVNGGKVYRPHVVKEIRSPDGSKVIKRIKRELLFEIPISKSTLEIVREGLRNVVLNGTARFLKYLPIAGKTGTVQTVSSIEKEEKQHAWFISYGPIDKPPDKQILIVVMVEYGKHGASAAPIAGRIFQELIKEGII